MTNTIIITITTIILDTAHKHQIIIRKLLTIILIYFLTATRLTITADLTTHMIMVMVIMFTVFQCDVYDTCEQWVYSYWT